jgi:hypothetical protein
MARNRDITTIQRAQMHVQIPDYISLSPDEADNWERIVRARHPDDWTESDLQLVGDLCKARALEKRVRDELEQGALMLAGKPHPLIAEASRCSGVVLKLVNALRLKTPTESRVLRGKARERFDYNEPDDLDGLVPRLRSSDHDELLPRLHQGQGGRDPSIARLKF